MDEEKVVDEVNTDNAEIDDTDNVTSNEEEGVDEETTLTLEQEILADLSGELSITDENYNEDILLIKIQNAIKEVKGKRKYPSDYSNEKIELDIKNYYSNIRNLALYDYSQIGANFQTSYSESSVNRNWVDRNKLFEGVYPIAKF